MNNFDDLNPYLVRQEPTLDENMNLAQATGPSFTDPGVIPQIFIGNIIRLNIGKLGTFFFTFSDSEKWRDESFTGIIEEAGRDFFIIKDVNSEDRFLLPLVYFLWAKFNGALTTIPPQ